MHTPVYVYSDYISPDYPNYSLRDTWPYEWTYDYTGLEDNYRNNWVHQWDIDSGTFSDSIRFDYEEFGEQTWHVRYDIMGSGRDIYGVSDPANNAPVPEPSTILLLGSGLFGLAWYGRKRKKA